MLVSELAEKVGLSVDTIRYYEKQGLLSDQHVTRLPNNYKDYNDAAVQRLKLVKQGKRLGFTLNELAEFIGGFETGTYSVAEQVAAFEDKIALIDQRIAELEEMKAYLAEKIKLVQTEPSVA